MTQDLELQVECLKKEYADLRRRTDLMVKHCRSLTEKLSHMDAALRSVSDVFAKEQERDATTIQNVQMTVVALNERMSDLKKVSEVIDMVNEKLFSNHTDCELTKQQFSNQIDDLKEDLESLKTEILTKITEVNSEVAGIKVITNGIKNKKKKSKRYRGLFWSCITAIIAVIALLADIKDLLLSFMN